MTGADNRRPPDAPTRLRMDGYRAQWWAWQKPPTAPRNAAPAGHVLNARAGDGWRRTP
jgi:hypothetical protein